MAVSPLLLENHSSWYFRETLVSDRVVLSKACGHRNETNTTDNVTPTHLIRAFVLMENVFATVDFRS